jgi:hypothetical protein
MVMRTIDCETETLRGLVGKIFVACLHCMKGSYTIASTAARRRSLVVER